jgi:hypothetical protein
MFQSPPIIVKKQVTRPRQDHLCAYDLPMKGKTQVRWVVVVGQRMWRRANANNTLLKISLCHVWDLDEMTVKSPCLKAFEIYSGNGQL